LDHFSVKMLDMTGWKKGCGGFFLFMLGKNESI
jgi:hypothetical protein